MQHDELYELVYEATTQAMADSLGGQDIRLSRRMVGGKVIFEDGDGRALKTVDASVFFRKVTAVREKLRVLEQKINNNGGLSSKDKAELQGYITRSYGSLTTFNFQVHYLGTGHSNFGQLQRFRRPDRDTVFSSTQFERLKSKALFEIAILNY